MSSNRARQPAHHLSHDEPLVFGDSSSEDCSSHLAAVFMRLCESESVLDLLSVPFTTSVFVMRLTAPRWGVVLRGATASGLFPGFGTLSRLGYRLFGLRRIELHLGLRERCDAALNFGAYQPGKC